MSSSIQFELFIAVLAGLLSFISPCVLPIVPGYLSFLLGGSLHEISPSEERARLIRRAVANSVVFVLGFSLLFTLMGASATTIGSFLRGHFSLFSKIAGALLIILGLHVAGLLRIPFLLTEKRMRQNEGTPGFARSFVGGILFGFGWTPCVGPILAGILSIAATVETVQRGILLLVAYSLGLGVPFILSAIFLNGFLSAFSKIRRHLHKVEIATGMILIALGGLIFFNKLGYVSSKLAFLNAETLIASNKNPFQAGRETAHGDLTKYDFELKTLDGRSIKLSDFKGKIVLVNFWAEWCGPCRFETPGLVRTYEKYKDRGLVIIGIAEDSSENGIRDFVNEFKIPYLIVNDPDGKVAARYDIFGYPSNFLFAPDGRLVLEVPGFMEESILEAKLKRLMP